MLTFNKITLAALATPIAIFLGACASGVHSPKIAQPAARGAEPFPVLQWAMIMPLVTDLDTMRAALPAFSLRDPADREVSVERILGFPHDSQIVSSQDLKRLELLKIYLRNNPTVGVRVEGYFGPARTGEPSSLALDRAQAIVRALLTDMRIQNAMSAVAALGPSSGTSQADIILIGQQSLDSLGLPAARDSSAVGVL
jgi:outer membrane protein OmpA-like peptidoglycan-associated protein